MANIKAIFDNGTIENQIFTAIAITGVLAMSLVYLSKRPNDPLLQFLSLAHTLALGIILTGMYARHR